MSPSASAQKRAATWGGVVIVAGLGVAFGVHACSDKAPAAPPTPPPTNKATLPDPNAAIKAGDGDPLAMFADPATPEIKFTLPELPFEEHSTGLPNTGTWRGYPLLADFTNDGRADLVVSNREEDGYNAWESAKTGPWIRRIEGLPRDMQYGPARAADVNSDGIPDLLLSAHTDALRVYLNDGKMGWTRSPAVIEYGSLLLDIALGNLNGDKNPDLVGISHFEGGLQIFLGDGKGGFQRLPQARSLLPEKTFGTVIELADVDGDGIDDIVTTTNRGLKVFLTKKEDPLRWEEASGGLPAPLIGNSLTAARPGRFIPGGWLQILVCGLVDPTSKTNDTIGLYAWDKEKRAWSHVDSGLPRTESYRDAVCGDLDKDGNLDLVVMSIESGGAIYRGDGKGGFTAKGRLAGVHGKGRSALGDIDGDGFLDIVCAVPASKDHPEVGGVRAFLNRPAVWK